MKEDMYKMEVTDKQSFARFLELLHEDYISNVHEWENDNFDRFLEAMIAYSKDIQGYYDNCKEGIEADTPTWQVFADILRGAKIYE